MNAKYEETPYPIPFPKPTPIMFVKIEKAKQIFVAFNALIKCYSGEWKFRHQRVYFCKSNVEKIEPDMVENEWFEGR